MNKDKIIDFIKHKNYYNSNLLINNPKPLKNQSEPTLIYYYKNEEKTSKIIYSIVIPIHNQEKIVKRNLESIFTNTVDYYELIIILDNCKDNTENIILELLNKKMPNNLLKIVILKQETSIFETSCDNLGFTLSEGKYIIEIQADMEMITYGYNKLLTRPVLIYDDIFIVSGRGSMKIKKNFKGMHLDGFGKLSKKIDKPLDIDFSDMNKVYIYETICRGPILIVNEKLKKLKYLDEQNFFLGNDDIDLCCRAFFNFNWKCCYYPLEFYAPLSSSTTKKKKNWTKNMDDEIFFFNERKNRSNGGFLNTIMEEVINKGKSFQPYEIRELPYNNFY